MINDELKINKTNMKCVDQDLIKTCLFVFIRGFLVLTLVEKTKPISQPSAGNPKSEYLNPKQRNLTEPNLKKQSQF